jgi:hypothetical protein
MALSRATGLLLIVALGLALVRSPLPGLGQVSTTQAPVPAGVFRIAGMVVNSLGGTPLARTRVTIEDARSRSNTLSAVTSENGTFEFLHVPAGKYGLSGAKSGFITASYEQHGQFSTAIVTGNGFDTEHLVLRLAPFAILSGKVDESGEPVRHANVVLYRQDRRVASNGL